MFAIAQAMKLCTIKFATFVLLTEDGCLIKRDELTAVLEESSARAYNHLSVLSEVLERRDWIVERSGSIAKALEKPLTALCARYLIILPPIPTT